MAVSRIIHSSASTDSNIKCGSSGNMEYKLAYFTLQSRRKRRTDFLLCNKSFVFRQLCALRALFNTICIVGRRVNWFTMHNKCAIAEHSKVMERDAIHLTY